MADEENAEEAPAEGEEPAEEAPGEEGAEEGGEGGEGEEGEGEGEEGEGEGEGEEGEDEEGEEGEGEEGEGEEGEEGGELLGEEGIISDESDVFNELMNAGGQAREAAAMIASLKASVKEFQTKEMLSAEDAAVLQAKQDELMAKLSEFGALTIRIQTLLQLSHLTESQLCLLEGPRPGEEEEETFDLEIEDETLPKVIICGSEDHIPRIVVCEPTTKKEPPLLKCCCAKHPILLGGFGDDTPGYKGDIAMDSLLKQLSSLQQEMKLINEENNFLSKKLSEIVDKSRCSVCNKPKALCRCDKPTGPPPCCVPRPAPPPCSPCCAPVAVPPPCCPPKPVPLPCCPPKPKPPPCCPPKATPPPCCPPKPASPPCCPPKPAPPPCCPPKPAPPPCCPKPAPPPCCPPKPKPICNCPLPQKPPCLCCPPCLCSGTPCCCAGVPAPPCPPPPCPPDPPLCTCCQQADKKDSSAAISQMECRLRNMITDVSKMQCQLRELQRLRQQLEEEKSDLCPCFDDLF